MSIDLKTPESLIREYLEYMKVDQLGLWIIAAHAKERLHLTDSIQIKEFVVNAVRGLLAHHVVIISYHPQEKSYEVWDMEPTSAIRRLEQEWDKLGRIPDLGEDGGIYFIYKEQLSNYPTIPAEVH